MDVKSLKKEFRHVFYGNNNHVLSFFAPGRVNLIGEHTDYNGGCVFPCALSFGTYAVASKRQDDKIRLYSKNYEGLGIVEVDINQLVYNKEHDWANYPKGVVKIFKDAGYKISTGFDMLYFGNIPNGAGLSSSASIELVTSISLKVLFDLNIDRLGMVKLSQKAENEFIGVNCGIMDQFACGMGKKDHAILLNTNTLKHDFVPLILKDISIIIANTNKRRDLAASKYNERRKESEAALKDLQKKLSINTLGDLSEEEFEANKKLIMNEVYRKRAKHAVYENQRTINAVGALQNRNIEEFGKLINESHISLKDDYEVSCLELDILVEAALEYGSIGSRMTGAGFGGCTINLVYNKKIEEFVDKVGRKYQEKTGGRADFYVATIGDGVRQIL
ncbi:galactokinase [Alkaliphilus peptidifermentans]|uniref:Galactokinase n=1 Tax=Alkaliphilus peptidifermentans DSM 18978 TaxID=1120976 RepID=A0A1G5L716_9FIRM|nr:galactokinase [Alkaliphilus peptidifermentans]SCZ08251.1 galactokinase [Alkaliphilus peptidifermentans DSM 18978]